MSRYLHQSRSDLVHVELANGALVIGRVKDQVQVALYASVSKAN